MKKEVNIKALITSALHYQEESSLDLYMAVQCYEQAWAIHQDLSLEKTTGPSSNESQDPAELQTALEWYENAFSINKNTALPDQDKSAKKHLDIAIQHHWNRNYVDAITSYEGALSIYQELNREEDIASTHGRLGCAYDALGEITKAIFNYNEANDIYETNQIQTPGSGNNCSNLARGYRRIGKRNEAETFYKKAIEINETIKALEGQASNQGNLGSLYETMNELEEAKKCYKKSSDLFEEKSLNSKDRVEANNAKSKKATVDGFLSRLVNQKQASPKDKKAR